MSYDGHGRLQNRKAPIEASPTIYSYYLDDTVKKVTDPRGASSTYTYNARHLVSGIAYCKPGCGSGATDEITAIPDVPPVGFGYDSAGNRTLMTDGLGRVDYVYNIWGQMTSETRSFADFPNSTFPVTYEYSLAGGLKKLTDPFGASINYAYNQAGQLTGVSGSNFAGVTQYASNIQYRAWGAMKHEATGDGKNTDFSYNNRLQVTSFVRGPNTFGHSTYQYHGDGRVSFVHNLDNPSFDRKYSYDHVGRLREGLSGSDARGETYDSDNPPPYKQTYTYDVFDNMNGRTNRYWTLEENPFAATYTNDRNTDWVYDDAGNVKNNAGGSYDWDTAGRMKKFNDPFLNQYYDGDGLPALRIENRLNLQDRKTIYYVRSSLLGGQPITELNAQGAKRRTYVYAMGQDIARQESAGSNYIVWINRDPITGDDDITRDPLGGYLGNPNDVLFPDYETLKGDAPTHDTDADPFDSGSGCTLDGVPINCSLAIGLANHGGAVQAPLKSIIPVTYLGQRTLAVFQATNDGYQGFVPVTGKYTGEGHIASINPPKLFRRGQLSGDTDLRRLNGVGDDDPEASLARSTVTGSQGSDLPTSSVTFDRILALSPALRAARPEIPIYCRPDVIAAMNRAWARTANGTSGNEAGFVLNGTPSAYRIVDTKSGNTKNQQSFTINTGGSSPTFLLFHVHPNTSTRFPSTPDNNALSNDKGDTGVANQYSLLFLVGHRDGLTLYDPATHKTFGLGKNLDWLKPCK